MVPRSSSAVGTRRRWPKPQRPSAAIPWPSVPTCPGSADLDELFARTKKRFGSIDVLFVNAGIAKFAPFEQTTEAMHDEILDINFKGAFFTVQKALPLLKDGGAIVINTSVVAGKSMPNGSVYAASKAALRSLTRTLGGGTARSQDPGERRRPRPDLDAHLRESDATSRGGEEIGGRLRQHVPMKRLGKSEEVAKAVVFLASDDASYITGVELNIDGGMGQL